MDTAFLFGAGASVDAGLPTTTELTKKIFDIISNHHSPYKAALSVVIGGLIFDNAIKHSNPYQQVDIEQVYGALLMLANRYSIEISPFVGSWHNTIDEIDKDPISNYEVERLYDYLNEALFSAFNRNYPRGSSIPKSKFVDAFLKILNKSSKHNEIFLSAAQEIINQLINILWLEDERANLEYLDPLKTFFEDNKPLPIYSLNYDNVIEQWATKNSIKVCRGIEGEYNGKINYISNAKIHLYKLHGSLDWTTLTLQADEKYPLGGEVIQQIEINQIKNNNSFVKNQKYQPAVVFGYGNKLTVEGPFLEIIRNFQNSLVTKKQLVVIGYSFRDKHINHFVADWFNLATENKLIIINGPQFKLSEIIDKRLKNLNTINNSKRLIIFPNSAKDGLPKLLRYLQINN